MIGIYSVLNFSYQCTFLVPTTLKQTLLSTVGQKHIGSFEYKHFVIFVSEKEGQYCIYLLASLHISFLMKCTVIGMPDSVCKVG